MILILTDSFKKTMMGNKTPNGLQMLRFTKEDVIKAVEDELRETYGDFAQLTPAGDNPSYQVLGVLHQALRRLPDDMKIQEGNKLFTLARLECYAICNALRKFRGNRRDVAAALEISERTLYRKIKDYEIIEVNEQYIPGATDSQADEPIHGTVPTE